MIIRYNVEDIIKRYPYTYQLYSRIVGNDIEMPDKNTDLHITGFPRSATTLMLYIFRESVQNIKVTSHIHTIADLKKAISENVCTVVMLRDPMESVSSSVVKRRSEKNESGQPISNFNDEITKKICFLSCQNYISYYKYVLNNKKKLIIGKFSKVLNNKTRFVKKVADEADFENVNLDKVVVAEKKYVKEKNEQNEKEKGRKGIPSEEKEKKKKGVKKLIRRLSCHDKLIQTYREIEHGL
jgi:hypothetical protein